MRWHLPTLPHDPTDHLERDQQRLWLGQRQGISFWRKISALRSTLNEKQKRWLVIGILAVAIGLIGLVSQIYRGLTVLAPDTGGTYIEGVVGQIRFLNPLYSSANSLDEKISKLIYAPLVRFLPDGTVKPIVAEKWEQQGTKYIFTLKKDLIWHDGEKLTAADVVFTFEAAASDVWQSPLRYVYKNIKATAGGDNIVILESAEPQNVLLSLASLGIIPRHIWAEVEPANAVLSPLNSKPVGLGAYKFSRSIRGDDGNIKSLELERFESAPETGRLDKIVLRVYNDSESALTDLLNKQLDALEGLSVDQQKKVIGESNWSLVNLTLPQFTGVFFRPSSDFLNQSLVRQALNLGLNREEVATIFGPGYKSINNLRGENSLLFDKNKASTLLDQAGYTVSGADGIRRKKNAEASFVLTAADDPLFLALAQKLREHWQSLGIKIGLSVVPKDDIRTQVLEPRKYEALLFSQATAADGDLYPLLHSSQRFYPGINLANVASRKLDTLLEQARTAPLDKREELYTQVAEVLRTDPPVVWLAQSSLTMIVSKKVLGARAEVISDRLDRMYLLLSWYKNTKRVWK